MGTIHHTYQDRFQHTQHVYPVSSKCATAQDIERQRQKREPQRRTTSVDYSTPVTSNLPTQRGDDLMLEVTSQSFDALSNHEEKNECYVEQELDDYLSIAGTQHRDALPNPVAQVVFTSTTEILLKMVAVYYAGCCETGLWYTCTGGRFRTRRPIYDAATVLDRFVGSWMTGLDSAKDGNIVNVHQALTQARGKLPRIIEAEHPSTIRALLEMILEYTKSGLYTLVLPVLQDIAWQNPSNLPLAIICRQILRVEPSAIENMALATLACAVDALAEQCGEYHYTVIRCRTALIKSESTYLDGDQVANLANRLLTGFETSSQFSVEGFLNICESLLENMDELGSLAEAEIMIQRMSQYALQLCPERTRKWTVRCVDLLSTVQYCQGKTRLAEQNCRWCIQELTTDFGCSDSRTQTCMSRLSKWLRLWNRFDEALEVESSRVIGLTQSHQTSCSTVLTSYQVPNPHVSPSTGLVPHRGEGFGNSYGDIFIGGAGNRMINGNVNISLHLSGQALQSDHATEANNHAGELRGVAQQLTNLLWKQSSASTGRDEDIDEGID